MKPPIVFPHIPQRRADAALSSDCVTASGKYFAYASGFQTFFYHAERSSQTRAAGAHYHDIVLVFYDVICRSHELP
jgi:hypothetical protein